MSFSLIITCIQIGLCFGIMAMGIHISFRILGVPDLTIDGAFTLGAAVSAFLCLNNLPILGLILGVLAGAIAGIITGLLHTKLKIQAVLAGILTMTALYSINFWVTKRRPSIGLYQNKTIFSILDNLKSISILSSNLKEILTLVIILAFSMIIVFALDRFFKTNLGLAVRATGDNEAMVKASSINTDNMKIIAFALSNALVALAGGLYVQLQRNYDNSYGNGMMVIGVASIIIGEAIFRKRKLGYAFLISIFGAIIYEFIFMLALLIDSVDPIDIKIITALIIILSVCIPMLYKKIKKGSVKHA
ncbi:MAG: ABC transporter permease [Bacilli bacterium]|nr:ABC transporter permease [Bacilli bacterium]